MEETKMPDPIEANIPQTEEADSERERSTIGFPYLDLDDAVEVARAVSEVGGRSCEWEQLAAKLQMVAKGGGFRMRVLTAKTFGMLSYDKSTVTLSEIGMRIVDGQQEKPARVDAFLAVPLYRRVYEEFKGTSLPASTGLENFMASVGVAQKQKDKARQVFLRSARQAGFFELSQDRLTTPAIRGSAKPITQEPEQPNGGSGGGGGGGQQPPNNLHPFIKGLLDTLPTVQTEWGFDARQQWLQTAAGIFNLIYRAAPDDKGTVNVTVSR
jgi:hypothetical protein